MSQILLEPKSSSSLSPHTKVPQETPTGLNLGSPWLPKNRYPGGNITRGQQKQVFCIPTPGLKASSAVRIWRRTGEDQGCITRSTGNPFMAQSLSFKVRKASCKQVIQPCKGWWSACRASLRSPLYHLMSPAPVGFYRRWKCQSIL